MTQSNPVVQDVAGLPAAMSPSSPHATPSSSPSLESMYSVWQVSAKLHSDSAYSPLRQFIDQNVNLWHYEHQLQRRPVIHGRRKSVFIHRDVDWYQPRRSLDVVTAPSPSSSSRATTSPPPPHTGGGGGGSSATAALLTNVTARLKELAFLHDRVHTHTSMFMEALNRQFPTKSGAALWRIPLRPLFDDDTRVEVLAVRHASLTSLEVHAAVNRLWTAVPKDHRGFLAREVHHQVVGMFFRRLAFDLVDETLRNELVALDWKLRADGRPSIDWERFTASMLCTLDVYCETAHVVEFVEFAEFFRQAILDAVSFGGPLLRIPSTSGSGAGEEESNGRNAAHYAVGAAAVRDITMRTLGCRNVTLHSLDSRSSHQALLDESVAMQQAELDSPGTHPELRHLGSTRSFLRASLCHSAPAGAVAGNRSDGTNINRRSITGAATPATTATGGSTAATKSLVGFITALVGGSIPKYDALTPLDRRTQVTMQLVRGDITTLPPPSRTIPKADLLPPSPAVLLPLRRERPLALTENAGGSRVGSLRSVSSKTRSYGSLRQMVKPRKIKATVKPDMAEEFLDKYSNGNDSEMRAGGGSSRKMSVGDESEPFSFLPRHSSDLVAGDSPVPSFRLRRRGSPSGSNADLRPQDASGPSGGQEEKRANELPRRFSDDPEVLACDSEDSDESVEEAVALVERHFTSRRSFYLEARRRTLAESAALAEAMASGRPLERRTSERIKSGEPTIVERSDSGDTSAFPISSKLSAGHRRQSAAVSFRDLQTSEPAQSSECGVGDHDDENVSGERKDDAITRRNSRASLTFAGVGDESDTSLRLQRRNTILLASSVVSDDAFQRTMADLTSEMSRALTEADRLAHQHQFQWEDRDQQRYWPLRELSVPTRFFKGLAAWKGPMHCPSNDLYPWYRPRVYGVASAISAVTLRRFANPYVYSLLWEPWLALRSRKTSEVEASSREHVGGGAFPTPVTAATSAAALGTTSALSEERSSVGGADAPPSPSSPFVGVDDARPAGQPLIIRWYFERDRTWEGEDRQVSSSPSESECGSDEEARNVSTLRSSPSGTRTTTRSVSALSTSKERRSRFRGPSLDVADWVPFSDAHCQLLTTWWLEGLTGPRVLPEIPDQLRERDMPPLGESDSRPRMQMGFDFSAIRGGRREQKKMFVDFETWRCGYAEENRRSSNASAVLFRRTSDFYAHIPATGSCEKQSGMEEQLGTDAARCAHPRILEGHRICAHQSFLWEYGDPSKTAWLPFPLSVQQRLTQWLGTVKAVDRAQVAKVAATVLQTDSTPSTTAPTTSAAVRKPKSTVSSSQRSKDRSDAGTGDEHDPLYDTLLEGVPLASLTAFQDHTISLSDNNDGMAMTSWSRSHHHITVPIRYSVLFFCRDCADAPIRVADGWLPSPVLRKRFLASRRLARENPLSSSPGHAAHTLIHDSGDPFRLTKPPQLTLGHMLTAALLHEKSRDKDRQRRGLASHSSLVVDTDGSTMSTIADAARAALEDDPVTSPTDLAPRALFQTNRSLIRNPHAAVEAEPPGMRQISVELLAHSCRKILSEKAVLPDDPSSRRLDPPAALLSTDSHAFHGGCDSSTLLPPDVVRRHNNMLTPSGLKGSMWKMKRFAHARTGGGMTTTLPVSKHSLAQRGKAGLEAAHAEAQFGLDLLATPQLQTNTTLPYTQTPSPQVRCRSASATTTTSAYCRRQAVLEQEARVSLGNSAALQERRQGFPGSRAATPISIAATASIPRDVEVLGLSQLNARLLVSPSKALT